MELLTLVLFALALNMDSFAAGVVYGVRNIKLPVTSLAIISLMSMGAISLSMLAGHTLAGYVSPTLAHRLGGAILLLIGLGVLLHAVRDKRQDKNGQETRTDEVPSTVLQIHIRSLGLVIQILREPSRADLDRSGIISAREAVLLGLALALDAFAAGFAVSMLGFAILPTALMVGVGHFLLTYLGLQAGMGAVSTGLSQKIGVLPGFILIALGLLKMH